MDALREMQGAAIELGAQSNSISDPPVMPEDGTLRLQVRISLVLSRRRHAVQACCRNFTNTAALATKSHAPRGAAASVNADARGSATIFASQASRGSQVTLGAVVMSVRRQHAIHHNERRRSAAGEGGALSS